MAKGHHRVYAGRAAGGQPACYQGAGQEYRNRQTQRERVGRLEIVEQGLHHAGRLPDRGETDGEAEDGESQHFPQHHPDHKAALRAEGHADPDFTGAAGNRVGHAAIEADARHDQREEAEGGAELREGALLADGGIDAAVLCGEVGHGHLRGELMNDLPDGSGDGHGIADGAQFK